MYIKPSFSKIVGVGYISEPTFSQNGRAFSAIFDNKQVKQWDTANWHETHNLMLTDDPMSVTFSPNGSFLAVMSLKFKNIVSIWSIAYKHRIGILNVESKIDEKFKLFFIDDSQLAVRTEKGAYVSYNISPITQSHKNLMQSQHHTLVKTECSLPHNALVFSPNGDDNKLTVFNEQTNQVTRSFYSPSAVYSAAISNDGSKIVAGSRESGAAVWDFQSGKLLYTVDQPQILLDDSNEHEILAVAFSSNGKLLATGDQHGQVLLWKANNGDKEAVIQSKPATSLVFSPDDKFLVVGNGLGGFQVYDVSSCK